MVADRLYRDLNDDSRGDRIIPVRSRKKRIVWIGVTLFISPAPALLCWIGGAWLAYRPSFSKGAVAWTVFGLVIFSAFIVGMWISLERPPLRTMGETRLWYSFFLPVAGVITYVRWRYKWILSFSTLLAFVFICVNLFKPEIHNKTLMPALQSPWFAPHVIVYMFSYAMLGAGCPLSPFTADPCEEEGD